MLLTGSPLYVTGGALKLSAGIGLLWVFLFIAGSRVNGQQHDYHIQVFDEDHGLRPGTINRLVKDTDGFLWILYPRFIQRFDGRSIRTYRPATGLENIFCDHAGRIWVTSIHHVFLYDKTLQQFAEVPVVSEDSVVQRGKVFPLPGGRVMLGTSTAFYEYDSVQHGFIRALKELPLRPRYGRSDFAWFHHSIFINRSPWVYRYNTLTGVLDSLPGSGIHSLFPFSEDSLLSATWTLSAYWFDFAGRSVTPAWLPPEYADKASTHLNARSIVEVEPGRYLVSAREGIFVYDYRAKQFERINLYHQGSELLTRDLVSDMKYDPDGYIWLASPNWIARMPLHGQSFGLMRLQPAAGNSPFGIDNIRGITEDDQGNIWVATGNGFFRWNRSRSETRLFLPETGSATRLNFPSVRGIHFDGKYVILGQSQYGMWLYNPQTDTYKRPKYRDEVTERASTRDFIDRFTPLRNGDMIATCRDHIYVLQGDTYELSLLDNPAAKENSNFCIQGRDGEVWIATTQALHLLDSSLHYLMKVQIPAENQLIHGAWPLADGRFLFSVVGEGMFTALYRGDSLRVEKYSPLFDGIYIMSIIEDRQGMIWASSENGIYRYDPKTESLNLFDHSDNVQGYMFHLSNGHISKDGYLFLGGFNGINYFKPESIRVRDAPLKVFIETVRGGPRDSIFYPVDRKAVLPSKYSSLEIEFVCPYYHNPDKVKFRYKLLGLDPEWKYIGNANRLRFPSLPPGEYTLLLEAGVNNNDWSASANTFSFYIQPPFWKTWWFMVLACLSGIGSLILFIRDRNKRYAMKQEELEAEQAINYFSTRMAEQTSVDGLLWDVAKNCIGRLQFEDCVIYMIDEERNALVQRAAYGPKSTGENRLLNPITIPLGQGISGAVAMTGKAEIIDDTTLDPRYIVDDRHRHSEITVPIVADGKILGVIDCEHSKKRFFTQRHLSILTTIASLCAAKIIKVKAEAEKTETERILMATKQQMADIEMQALRAQMNPHFIFNCLNSINRYIVKSDQATASLYLTRFAKLIRLILDNSNAQTVTLTNELEALRLYIEMESIRFEKQFTHTITVESDVHPDHVYVPPLIIQPYVENAIWHGLLHKETAGHLDIRIRRGEGALLECSIEDNGVGRQKAKELKSKSASNNKSLGMKLTENRLAILNTHSAWNASVDILDLLDDQGEAAGTKVILKIPIDS